MAMRQINSYSLWLGHAADARDLRSVHLIGIGAIVDLAIDEPPVAVTRELVYCRFPLLDGADNPSWLLRAAVTTTAELLRAAIPTLVACSNGMSRSPCIAAAALYLVSERSLRECLEDILRGGRADVSPSLWGALMALSELRDDKATE